MRWADLEVSQPRLAELGYRRLVEPGVVLVATIRMDGTPRVSPVEPLVMDGELWLSMMLGSAKARDLLRDDRILVHGIVTSRDGAAGEFKVRGGVRHETSPEIHAKYAQRVASDLGWHPEPGHFHLFAVHIESVTYLRYDDGDQYLTMWPPGQETVRRRTTATSVGDPQPAPQLLVDPR
jgi:hypothetical protein